MHTKDHNYLFSKNLQVIPEEIISHLYIILVAWHGHRGDQKKKKEN